MPPVAVFPLVLLVIANGSSNCSSISRVTVTFPLTGEPLALDLLNTRTAAGDLVADPAGLEGWLAAQAGRLTPVGEVGAAEVAAVRAVREAARPALEAARCGER
ncbi:ABATE domain-containing protein, partial [Streptomyces sp. ISL-86]|nr:ABATE domain-containing protein [Streptomyces sp. ISL-86]